MRILTCALGICQKNWKKKNNYILVDLMKAFIVSQEWPFILQLIQKIPDFKTWVVGCLKDGLETLVRFTNLHLFRPFFDSLGWPIMQYKVSPIDNVWSPTNEPPIKLWEFNLDGSPKLPTRVPSPIPYRPIWGNDVLESLEKEKFISVGLSKYLEFWKQRIDQNTTYVMKMASYIEYWEDILLHLSKPLLF